MYLRLQVSYNAVKIFSFLVGGGGGGGRQCNLRFSLTYSLSFPVREWPRVKKPIQIIRSKSNKLSNRFYPYPEITVQQKILSLHIKRYDDMHNSIYISHIL